jgi:hypothetical protein
VATGVLAWQFQLEGQKMKGILLLHLILAGASTVMIWLVWWVHFRARRRAVVLPGYFLMIECLSLGVIALTGHLEGFTSGVNGPGQIRCAKENRSDSCWPNIIPTELHA